MKKNENEMKITIAIRKVNRIEIEFQYEKYFIGKPEKRVRTR